MHDTPAHDLPAHDSVGASSLAPFELKGIVEGSDALILVEYGHGRNLGTITITPNSREMVGSR